MDLPPELVHEIQMYLHGEEIIQCQFASPVFRVMTAKVILNSCHDLWDPDENLDNPGLLFFRNFPYYKRLIGWYPSLLPMLHNWLAGEIMYLKRLKRQHELNRKIAANSVYAPELNYASLYPSVILDANRLRELTGP